MHEKAIVGVDFSPAGELLEQALPKLKQLGTRELTLVHVMATGYGSTPQSTHEEHYRGELEALAERLRRQGFSVEVDLRSGEPALELERAALESSATLIVAGTRGHRPLRDLFLGNVALGLARTARRALLLLPLGQHDDAGDTLVLATDGSAQAEAAEAAALALLALKGQFARVLAVSVADSGDPETREQYTRTLEAHLSSLRERAPVETRVLEGDPARTIVDVAAREKAGLLVLGKRGHNPLTELLLGSTAERVLRRATVPVLMVPG